MNPKELYEQQYGEVGPKDNNFFLRKIFKKYDLNREDLAISLLDKGENLLDIGCGSGSLLYKAKDKYTNLYGIDIVPENIKRAKELLKETNQKVELTVMDVNNGIEFPENFFDAVTIIATLSFIYDPIFMIEEINRVLKNRGILIVQVSNIAYFKQRIKLLFGQLPITTSPDNWHDWKKVGWDRGSLHYFNFASLKWLLESNGFKIEQVTGSGLFANLRNWWPSLLTGDIIIKARKINEKT